MRKRLLTLLPAIAATFLVVGGFAWAQTTNLASLRVGTAGEGGVTFFNGSIVNESGPVVVADDLRVDGVITRLDGTADKPVRVNDEFNVTGDVTLDEDLAVTGDVTAANLYTKSEVDALVGSSGTVRVYASDLKPAGGDESYSFNAFASPWGVTPDSAINTYLHSTVDIPVGATVTSLTWYGIDNGSGSTSVTLFNCEIQDDTGCGSMVMVDSTGSDASLRSFSGSVISGNGTVSSVNVPVLRVYMNTPDGSPSDEAQFQYAEITYTTS